MFNQSKNLVKIIGIGDFACQIINMLFDAGIPNTYFFVCHSKSEILENSKVSGKIKLNEDLKNSSGISINSDQNLKTLFQNTPPGLVFFLTDIKDKWNQDATTLLAQFANKKDQLTIAILTSHKAKGRYYTQWDTDPTRFIDTIFHFENNETNMKFGMPNSQKGMNKIHRETACRLIKRNYNFSGQHSFEKINPFTKTSGRFHSANEFPLNDEQHYDKNKFASFAKEIIETFTTITDRSAPIALDTYDLETMLKGSSNVLIGKATADGKDRAIQVVKNAVKEDMKDCHKALLFIQSGSIEVTMNEVGEMTDYLQSHISEPTTIMWGSGTDTFLGNNIKATIVTSK